MERCCGLRDCARHVVRIEVPTDISITVLQELGTEEFRLPVKCRGFDIRSNF